MKRRPGLSRVRGTGGAAPPAPPLTQLIVPAASAPVARVITFIVRQRRELYVLEGVLPLRGFCTRIYRHLVT